MLAALLLVATAATITWYADLPREGGPPSAARDPLLDSRAVFLYRAADSTRAPRAMLVFFGNDIGFWAPHRALAWQLSRSNIAVVGLDLRDVLDTLPSDSSARASALRARIKRLVDHARHELGAECSALLVGGHSLGAEIAIWYAERTPGIAGVLAMSPGGRSHLTISLSDVANIDPSGPGSFAVADALTLIPPDERVAIVRGAHDGSRAADSTLLAAGRGRTERFVVPLGGHSLKKMLLASLELHRALAWICATGRCGPQWRS